jgi:adenylosuccinate synthase
MARKVDLIIDLQYGSTGKGLLAGYLSATENYDVVVNANMPNAGHTYIDVQGNKMIHKVLPSGIVSAYCKYVLLGPGSVFDIEQLAMELEQCDKFGYRDFIVMIHPNAVVLTDHHRNAEAHMDGIGSTKQGSAAAMVEKIMRNSSPGKSPLAEQYRDVVYGSTDGRATVVTHDLYRMILRQANKVLAEGAQGYSLGVNQHFWPYCTSRECTPARFLSDMMIPLPYLNAVYGTMRVHPIRVGGSSGPCYSDQMELKWEHIGQKPELTTVTKKQRRVFSFSYKQIDDAIWECNPHHIFLNFVNYDEEAADKIIKHYGDLIRWVGMGPAHDDVKTRAQAYD